MINQQILNIYCKQVYSIPVGEMRFLSRVCSLTNHMILSFIIRILFNGEKKNEIPSARGKTLVQF